MRKTTSAGGIVVNKNGEILLTTKTGEFWMFPKGHVEEGEDLLTAALREVIEETGLPAEEIKVADKEPLGFFERFQGFKDGSNPDDEFKKIYLFHFITSYTEQLKPIDQEHQAVQWFSRDKVSDLLKLEKDREFFNSVIDKI
jgi:8-oxo-dGTP pyrophosphatase MutT (NUDIX family)